MATQKSTQPAPAASVNDCSKVVLPKDRVFSLALDSLRELYAEREDLFCLACAGEQCGTAEAIIEQGLFRVIQRITEITEKLGTLRGHIETLAQHAGIEVEVQS